MTLIKANLKNKRRKRAQRQGLMTENLLKSWWRRVTSFYSTKPKWCLMGPWMMFIFFRSMILRRSRRFYSCKAVCPRSKNSPST